MKKYWEIFKYSLKTQINFLLDYVFSLFSFAIHIFVFNELWDYILQDKLVAGYQRQELIWYIIVAEFMVYSVNGSYRKIAELVKNGEVANMLIKPVDFVGYLFAEDLSVILQAFINMLFAIGLGLAMAGSITISWWSAIITGVAAFLGILIGILVQIFIGLLAFYTEENKAFHLIIQKLTFFLVFTPIEFYPPIVQKLLFCLPTTYMIYGPAKIWVNFSFEIASRLIFAEIVVLTMLYGVVRILYRKGVAKINVNGG